MGNGSDSNPMPEEAVVRSVDVGPDNEGNEYLNRALQEHYVLKESVNLWQGPKYPAYCSLIDRVLSFENINWPETNPTPVLLVGSGVFCDSKLTTFKCFL
jgi:hypothetical protein